MVNAEERRTGEVFGSAVLFGAGVRQKVTNHHVAPVWHSQ